MGKKEPGFFVFVGWRGQDGVTAGRMKAQNHLGAWRTFHAEALGADGHAPIGADLHGRAEAPNIGPPRAARGGAQDGAPFFLGQIPGLLRGQTQFAMDFVAVAMESQSVDVGVGGSDLGHVFAGEIGREAALPELMFALDFPFRLRRWGLQETDVIEFQRPAELRQRVGIVREEQGVMVDVDLPRSPVAQESGGEEIEVGQEAFPTIEFGTDEHAAAIVEPIEHGKVQRALGEPAMGRSVPLPEFADLGALPAAHRGGRALGRRVMRMIILDRPAADLGTVELEGMQAPGFGGGKAVGARRGAIQPFLEEVGHRLGPSGGVVATRGSRDPQARFLAGAGAQVSGGEGIEAAARQAELFGRFGGRQGALAEGSQHMPDKRRGVTIR